MSGSFRIKVDLSDFFEDCRKESYIFVKQEWSSIKSIQSHICQLFNLTRNPLLVTGDGVFLPPDESIRIVNQFDSIKVRRNSPVVDPKAFREAKFSSNSTLLDHCNLPALFSTNETPIVSKVDLLKKRSQSQAAAGVQLKKSKLSISFDGLEVDEDDAMDVEQTPNISQKKTRKRCRKKKGKTPVDGGSMATTPILENGHNGSNHKDINSESKNNDSSKHTRFNAIDMVSSTSENEEEEEVNGTRKFRAEKIPLVSRIIKGIRTPCPSGMVSVDTERFNGGQVIECSSVVDDSDLQIHVSQEEESEEQRKDDGEEAPESNASMDVNKSVHLETLRTNLTTYPALEVLPNKNDIIGFKILKMSENYVPELSDYVIGMVETVDSDTMDLEIVILAGNEELKQHQEGGKFSLPDCNDTLVDIDDGTLHINWIELKEVRIVPSN